MPIHTIMTMHQKQQKRQYQTELGQTSIKESTTHSIEKADQWPTSVALDANTLLGLGGVDIDSNKIDSIESIQIQQNRFTKQVETTLDKLIGALFIRG